MSKIKYKISARATILLGREGVSKADGAMVELIKNTYDADADLCFVCIDKKNDKIYVFDNGTGMDVDTIQNCWMLIGTANKRDEYKSKKLRIKSGEKGIGRFALDRLGSMCTMFTRDIHNDNIIKWATNWNEFESTDKTLDEMEADIDEINDSFETYLPRKMVTNINLFVENINNKQNEKDKKIVAFKTGTLFIIGGLRDLWSEKEISKFVENLGTLLPPKEQTAFYLCVMKNGEDEYRIIENQVTEDYDYKINSKFDGKTFKITIDRNEFDLNKIPQEVFERSEFQRYPFRKEDFKTQKYSKDYSIKELLKTDDNQLISKVKKIGCFSFDYIFMKMTMQDDSKETFFYREVGRNRRDWLNEYGGIKIYRDNFFVRPYGDQDADAFDWLGLDARRAKNPAAISHEGGGWHARNKQSQGTVFISRVNNQVLLDKSNREGIIENEYFTIFKNLLIAIISTFERDRAFIGKTMKAYSDEVNEKEKAKEEAQKIAEELLEKENKSKTDDKSDESKKHSETSNETKLAKAVQYYEEERVELLSEIQQLKALATNGLITSTIAHDLKGINAILVNRVDSLRKAIIKGDPEKLERHLRDLYNNDEFLKSWLSVVSSQARRDKRKRKKCNVYETIRNIVSVMEPILRRKKVDLVITGNREGIERKIFESDFESIIYNLVINSIEAFEKCIRDTRNIIIDIIANDMYIIINYNDNGPGLDSIFTNPYEIFDFGSTSKKDKEGNDVGTGMGMYIVSSTIREYNASYRLTKTDNGFGLEIKIPWGENNGKDKN